MGAWKGIDCCGATALCEGLHSSSPRKVKTKSITRLFVSCVPIVLCSYIDQVWLLGLHGLASQEKVNLPDASCQFDQNATDLVTLLPCCSYVTVKLRGRLPAQYQLTDEGRQRAAKLLRLHLENVARASSAIPQRCDCRRKGIRIHSDQISASLHSLASSSTSSSLPLSPELSPRLPDRVSTSSDQNPTIFTGHSASLNSLESCNEDECQQPRPHQLALSSSSTSFQPALDGRRPLEKFDILLLVDTR